MQLSEIFIANKRFHVVRKSTNFVAGVIQARTSDYGLHALFLFFAFFVLYTSSVFANTLPDYTKLVAEQSAAVVRVTAHAPVIPTSANSPDSQTNPEQMPEFFKRYFEQNPDQPGPTPRRGTGFGSGFIIDTDGYVVTNAHVVEGAEKIRIALHDRREFEATLIGADKRTDLALLKIDADELVAVKLGDSDKVAVGQWVLAIGSPFGFEYTATQGIVSGVSRSLRGDSYVPFIQTDAAVNPGNSGGPLFDTEGKVIGVNSQIYTRSGGYMGLSFAIPVNVVKNVTQQLMEKGYTSYGWLGVMIQDMDKSLAESFALDRPGGALVSQVTPDSPAQEAGIQTGDVILSFAGKDVVNSSGLPPLVGLTKPGVTVDLQVIRDGKPLTLQVTVGEQQQDRVLVSTAPKKTTTPSLLGMQTMKLSRRELDQLNIKSGIRAGQVIANGPAAEAGIRNGDVIVSFNKIAVESPRQLDQLVDKSPRDQSVPVLVLRDRTPHFIALKVPKA
jgi:serine protease Do